MDFAVNRDMGIISNAVRRKRMSDSPEMNGRGKRRRRRNWVMIRAKTWKSNEIKEGAPTTFLKKRATKKQAQV